MRSKRIRILFAVALSMLVITCGLAVTVYALNGAEDGTICDGVYVNSIPLGGMTTEEAEKTIDDYVNGLKNTKVSLLADGEAAGETTLAELGFEADSQSFIQEAEAVGKTGNLIERYKQIKDVEAENMQFNLTFGVDESAIREFVESTGEAYAVPAKNAGLKRKDGKFVITPQVNGRKVNVDDTVSALTAAVLEQWDFSSELSVDLAMEDELPQFTEEDMKKCTTVLGTYTTQYPTGNRGRAQNVENGANLVNGSVMYPGDVLSVNDKLKPYTVENGYGIGGAYQNGEVIDSIGGGICQVSTTLYNAILYSELEIVERAAHSMTVNYVPLSRDAAIAGDYKDLKFKNNLDYPIYVEGYAKNGSITFTIYGYETRDMSRHKVDFEYEIVDTKKPGKDIVKEDPTKPTTYEEVTQGAFTGYTTNLYKLTYEDGKLVERKRINTSYYQPSPRYVTKGTKETEEEEDKKKDTDKDKDTDKNKDTGKNKDTNKNKDTDKNKDKTNKNDKTDTGNETNQGTGDENQDGTAEEIPDPEPAVDPDGAGGGTDSSGEVPSEDGPGGQDGNVEAESDGSGEDPEATSEVR